MTDIDRARTYLESSLGTPRESLARTYLEIVIDKDLRRRTFANPLPPWCCASGCQGCTEFQEHSKEQG